MAKKRAKRGSGNGDNLQQGELGDWTDKPPEEVQEAVDRYVKALRARNKANEKVNSDKELVIERMREHGITRVRIDEGAKMLVLKEKDDIKIEKVKEEAASAA